METWYFLLQNKNLSKFSTKKMQVAQNQIQIKPLMFAEYFLDQKNRSQKAWK